MNEISYVKTFQMGSRNSRILKKWGVKPTLQLCPMQCNQPHFFGMVIVYPNVSIIEESDQNLEYPSIGAC
jgi:hypothetical protein